MAKQNVIDIKRAEAATVINELRMMLAREIEDNGGNTVAFTENLRKLLQRHDIPVPEPCAGEAHSNAHIDHCGVCMSGEWGWAYSKPVRVR